MSDKKERKSDTLDSPKPGTSKEPDWNWDDQAWGYDREAIGRNRSCLPLSLPPETDHTLLNSSKNPNVKLNDYELEIEEEQSSTELNEQTIYVADEIIDTFSDDGNKRVFNIGNEEVVARQVKFGDIPQIETSYENILKVQSSQYFDCQSETGSSSGYTDEYVDQYSESQVDYAHKEFLEDEKYYAFMYRPREWKRRKQLALQNFNESVELFNPRRQFLFYNIPVKILNTRTHPFNKDTVLSHSIAVYITPETISENHLYAYEGAPISLSMETKPVYRNVFEIVSAEDNMIGLPVTYRAVVYIRLLNKDQTKNFYLTCNNVQMSQRRRLYLTDALDQYCQFEILPLDEEDNWRSATVTEEMYIRHTVSKTFITANCFTALFNIFGEERLLNACRPYYNLTQRWIFCHGFLYEDVATTSENSGVESLQSHDSNETFRRHISEPNISISDNFVLNKPPNLKKSKRICN